MTNWGPCTWTCRYRIVSFRRRGCMCVEGQDSQFEPVSNDDTENVKSKFECDKLAARCVGSSLCGPNRCDGVQDARSNTIQYSSYNECQRRLSAFMILYRHLPQNIQFAFIEADCKAAAKTHHRQAIPMVVIRPYLSPHHPPSRQPTSVPGR